MNNNTGKKPARKRVGQSKKGGLYDANELYSFDMVGRLMRALGRTTMISEIKGSHYDLTDDTGRLIEVKFRRVFGDEFKKFIKNGFYLEKAKYDHLKDSDSLYINLVSTTVGDYFFVWNIGNKSTMQLQWKTMLLDKTTDFGGEKINKEIAMLPVNANMFRYRSGEILRVTTEEILNDLKNEF